MATRSTTRTPRGPSRTLYRFKNRMPISVKLTDEGRRLMEQHTARTHLERSDLFEELLRNFAHKIKPVNWRVVLATRAALNAAE